MATEITPIYDTVASDLGSPIPATAIDCSYAAMVKLATAGDKAKDAPAGPIALPAPATAKRPVKSAPAKPFAVVAGDKAS